jgi:hypothetical protein
MPLSESYLRYPITNRHNVQSTSLPPTLPPSHTSSTIFTRTFSTSSNVYSDQALFDTLPHISPPSVPLPSQSQTTKPTCGFSTTLTKPLHLSALRPLFLRSLPVLSNHQQRLHGTAWPSLPRPTDSLASHSSQVCNLVRQQALPLAPPDREGTHRRDSSEYPRAQARAPPVSDRSPYRVRHQLCILRLDLRLEIRRGRGGEPAV